MRRFEDWSRSLMSREPLRVLLLATDRAACLPVELRDELQSVFEDSNFALPKCNRILPFWASEIGNVASVRKIQTVRVSMRTSIGH